MKNFNYLNLSPFQWFVVNNFPFIEEDFDAITNYQLLCKVIEYLNKVIATTNETGKGLEELSKQFTDLYNYVNNFLDNLDLEEPINKKLDEMVEDGTLERLINVNLFEKLQKDIDNPLIGNYKTIENDGKYNAWPVTLVRNGRIFCYYNKRYSHQNEQGYGMKGNKICMRYSDDEGLTWSDEQTLFYDENFDYTTFGGIALQNGTILLWINEVDIDNDYYTKYYQYSSQDGINFTKTYTFNDSTNRLVAFGGYLNMGIMTKTGRIITSKQTFRTDDNTRKTIVLYSDSQGLEWNAVEVFSKVNDGTYNNMPYECRFVETDDGIIGIGRNDSGYAFQFTSTDNGDSWTQPTVTNLQYSRRVPISLFYYNHLLTIISCDRYANGIYKTELLSHAIFENPTLYPTPELIEYSSSNSTARDWGYGNIIQYNQNRPNSLAYIFYTTKDKPVNIEEPKNCEIALLYFNTYNYKSYPNLLRNGNFEDCLSNIDIENNVPTWLGDNIAIKTNNNINVRKSSNPSTKFLNLLFLTNVNNTFNLYSFLRNEVGRFSVNIKFYSFANGTLNIFIGNEKIGTFNINTGFNNLRESFFAKEKENRIRFEFIVTNNVTLYEIGVSSSYSPVEDYSEYYNDSLIEYEEKGLSIFNTNWNSSTSNGTYTNLNYSNKVRNPKITVISRNNVEGKITPRTGATTFKDDVNVTVQSISKNMCIINAYSPISDNASVFIANKIIIDSRPDISNI